MASTVLSGSIWRSQTWKLAEGNSLGLICDRSSFDTNPNIKPQLQLFKEI
jgi:hypothetical protein